MKLTSLKGIAHDLINHLDHEICFGHLSTLRPITYPYNQNILTAQDNLSKECLAFFQERLSPSFNKDRIKEISLKINKKENHLQITIGIKVDDTEFTQYGGSISYNHTI